MEPIVQRGLEKLPHERPRIINDNGLQFIADDFKVSAEALTPTRGSRKSRQSFSRHGEHFRGTLNMHSRTTFAILYVLFPFGLVAPLQRASFADDSSSAKRVGEVITNTIGMRFAFIPPGDFMMGSPEDSIPKGADEFQHRVRITRSFYIGVTEVTQEEWRKVMKTRPWADYVVDEGYVREGAEYPASEISWEAASAFCKRMSDLDAGRTYRLPTEAEWEYACRAGTNSQFCFGDDDRQKEVAHAWCTSNTLHAKPKENYNHKVAQKRPNQWGLYDMHGNVLEWCSDYYDENYYQRSPVDDPRGAEMAADRVQRGGMWGDGGTRSADRRRNDPKQANFLWGFRVVLETAKN